MGSHTGQQRPLLILYRFKTHRKVPELGIHEISYGAR